MHTFKTIIKGLLSQKTKTTLTAVATTCATTIITCLIAFFYTATLEMTEEMQAIQRESRISLQIHTSDKKIRQITYQDYLTTIKPQFENYSIAASRKSYTSIFLDDKNTRHDYFEHVMCDYAYLDANNLSMQSGRFFDQLETPNNNFVILGSKVAQLTSQNTITQQTPSLFIHKKKHIVLGVLAQQSEQPFVTRADINKTIYTHIHANPEQSIGLDEITIQIKNTKEADEVHSLIKKIMQIHFPEVRYQIINTTQTAKQIENYINKIKFVLISFGIISTLIASINITNNMYAIISERFQEIGIRLAIGATTQQIKKLLLAETGLLAALSAIIGVAIGELLNMLLIRYLNWDYQFYIYSGLISFIMMNIISILSCYIPLRKIDTINPIKVIQSL